MDDDKYKAKGETNKTYASIKAKNRIQELELIAFATTSGEDIEELLGCYDEKHGTNLKMEYCKLAYGDD